MRKLQITQLAAMNMHYSRYSIDAFLDLSLIRPSAGRLPPRFAGWRRTGG